MAKRKESDGNPHVRFDGGKIALAATPRRGVLRYGKMMGARNNHAKQLMVCMAAFAVAYATVFAADIEWPVDFDAQVAAHIAAERSTNTTSEAYAMQIDSCYRTVGNYDFAVSRTAGSGLYFIIR